MVSVLTIMLRFLFLPVWLLWKAYVLLWWAFDDDPPPQRPNGAAEPLAGAPQTQNSSFEITDSRAPAPAPRTMPRGALRGGFAGSLVGSGLIAAACSAATGEGVATPGRAALTWAYLSALVLVASLLAVRHVVRRERRRRPLAQRARDAATRIAQGATRGRLPTAVRTAWARAAAWARRRTQRPPGLTAQP